MNESVMQTDPFTWFQKYQLEAVIKNGVVPEWFHGIISRKASEELLMSKPPGYFLIRVSESRIGYTLSYRAEDCCRHFMIDALKDGYVILGDDRHHPLLENLVDFHRMFPIKPYNEFLTLPCGQASDVNIDYEELLFPSSNAPQLHTTKSIPVPDVPPVLPCRPSSMMDPAAQPSNIQSSRLYPSLDLLQSGLPCFDLPQAAPVSREPHTANAPKPSQPPELPSRNVTTTKKNHLAMRTKSDSVDSVTSVVTNFKKFKKKLYRKSNSCDQALQEEVPPKEEAKSETNVYHEIAHHHVVQSEPSGVPMSVELPQEYLPPPPFAPGYK